MTCKLCEQAQDAAASARVCDFKDGFYVGGGRRCLTTERLLSFTFDFSITGEVREEVVCKFHEDHWVFFIDLKLTELPLLERDSFHGATHLLLRQYKNRPHYDYIKLLSVKTEFDIAISEDVFNEIVDYFIKRK